MFSEEEQSEEELLVEEFDEDITEDDYEKHLEETQKKSSKNKKFTTEEINELIRRAKKEDQIAWEKIFKAYEPFIVYMKNKTRPMIFGSVTEEDLESYVYEGLVKAVRSFDESKDVKFISFAVLITSSFVTCINVSQTTSGSSSIP